jgi:ABC-type antimicrobial peptide transport system permease subunit
MYKLNFIAILGIVASVSLVVGMAAPAAFATLVMATPMGDNMTMNMGNNMSSTGNMTGNGNGTSMAESESIPSANQTGVVETHLRDDIPPPSPQTGSSN